jgi:tripartite-type tricarboxylate transporter receptor subunit TctC
MDGNAQIGRQVGSRRASSQRSPALPDVPTTRRQVARLRIRGLVALLAPRHAPEIVKRLHDGSVAALRRRTCALHRWREAHRSTPEELTKYIQSERVKWAEVVKRSGATVE